MKATSVIVSLLLAAGCVSAEPSPAFAAKTLNKDFKRIAQKAHDASLDKKNSKTVQENAHDLENLLKMFTPDEEVDVEDISENENSDWAKPQQRNSPLDFLNKMKDPDHPLNMKSMGSLFKNLSENGKSGNIASMLQNLKGADFGLDNVDFDKVKETMQNFMGPSGSKNGMDLDKITEAMQKLMGPDSKKPNLDKIMETMQDFMGPSGSKRPNLEDMDFDGFNPSKLSDMLKGMDLEGLLDGMKTGRRKGMREEFDVRAEL